MKPSLPIFALLAASGLLIATSPAPAEPVPDFRLEDMNPASPRYGDTVSPRDYRHQVSAYYFGSST